MEKMTQSFKLEIVRQALRALSVWLLALGMPNEFEQLFAHPQAAEITIAMAAYLIAEAGWVVAKVRQWWAGDLK